MGRVLYSAYGRHMAAADLPYKHSQVTSFSLHTNILLSFVSSGRHLSQLYLGRLARAVFVLLALWSAGQFAIIVMR